jgi:hypothetical protein
MNTNTQSNMAEDFREAGNRIQRAHSNLNTSSSVYSLGHLQAWSVEEALKAVGAAGRLIADRKAQIAEAEAALDAYKKMLESGATAALEGDDLARMYSGYRDRA